MNYREKWFSANKSDHGWYTCAKCGKKIHKCDVDIDHIIPQKYGGSDELYNLQCLCKHCNRSKQAKLKGVASNLVKHNVKRAANKVLDNIKARAGRLMSAGKTKAKSSKSRNS